MPHGSIDCSRSDLRDLLLAVDAAALPFVDSVFIGDRAMDFTVDDNGTTFWLVLKDVAIPAIDTEVVVVMEGLYQPYELCSASAGGQVGCPYMFRGSCEAGGDYCACAPMGFAQVGSSGGARRRLAGAAPVLDATSPVAAGSSGSGSGCAEVDVMQTCYRVSQVQALQAGGATKFAFRVHHMAQPDCWTAPLPESSEVMTFELYPSAAVLAELAASRAYEPSVSTEVGGAAISWAFTPTKGYSLHYSFSLEGSRQLASVCEGGACHFRLASGGICVSGTVQQQQAGVEAPALIGAGKTSRASSLRKSLAGAASVQL
jgi:hypothetical protein